MKQQFQFLTDDKNKMLTELTNLSLPDLYVGRDTKTLSVALLLHKRTKLRLVQHLLLSVYLNYLIAPAD